MGFSFSSIGRSIERGFRQAVTHPLQASTAALSTSLYPITGTMAYLGGLQQGGFRRGADQAGALATNPNDFWSNPQNRSMMALTSAEIAAIALTAGAASGGLTSASGATLVPNAAGYATAAGVTAAGAYGNRAMGASVGSGSDAVPPPDVNEANDPNAAQQFQRIRRAARALGRSGTIKSRSYSDLGLGEQLLGDQLSLIGS